MNCKWPSNLSWRRNYSTMKHILPAKAVRNRFLEYFTREKDHTFVKSSPVISYFDSTIPFVNAGMCQFKKVFTGDEQIDVTKAANSQKCIRVGGKHNDLNLVGVDSYHHTFFEMLGNWSFGAYGKKEACQFAWDLLTSPPYNIPPSKLFVTYFKGDEKLGLPADDEVRNIWLELGMSDDRILPFGMKENFWEMSATGPCGTCTEIHVALTDEFRLRSDLVNTNNPLLCELWNIVFIKYNKTENSLKPLSNEFVDTGMGFERLTTLLQQKCSSYHTDLFTPFYDLISKVTSAPAYAGTFEEDNLDASYRRLADFSRMATVAIADNVFPDLNPKLRRILRRSLLIAQSDFKCEKADELVQDLSMLTADALQDTFPEIGNNMNQVKLIIEHEHKLLNLVARLNKDHWRFVRRKFPILKEFCFLRYPNLPNAYEYLQKYLSENRCSKLKPETIFYLYDTFGLDKPVVELLAHKLELEVDWNKVEEEFIRVKEQSRNSSLAGPAYREIFLKLGFETDDSEKRSYVRNDDGTYQFPDIQSKLLAILDEGNIVSVAGDKNDLDKTMKPLANANVNVADKLLGFVFDRTNFYVDPQHDFHTMGHITILREPEGEMFRFEIERIKKIDDVVIHYAKSCDKACETLKAGMTATLSLDAEHKLKLMRNFTITHLLLLALRDMYPISYEKDDTLVNHKFSQLTCRVLGRNYDPVEDKELLEKKLKEYISTMKFSYSTVHPGMKLLDLPGIRMAPCMVYPYKKLNLVTITDENGNIVSREPCNGIHLAYAADIKQFEVTKMLLTPSSDLKLIVYTSDMCHVETENEIILRKEVEKYESDVRSIVKREDASVKEIIDTSNQLSSFMYKTMFEYSSMPPPRPKSMMSYTTTLQNLLSSVSAKLAKLPRETVIREMVSLMQKKTEEEKVAVYFCLLNYDWYRHDSFKIDILYRIPFPAMLFNYRYKNRKLTGVSHVPEAFVTEDFNARTWMESVIIGYNMSIIEEDDMRNYCFIKFDASLSKIHKLIERFTSRGVRIAKQYVTSDSSPNEQKITS